MSEDPGPEAPVKISVPLGQAILLGLLALSVGIVVVSTLRGQAAQDGFGGFLAGLGIGSLVLIAGASLLAWAITPPAPPLPGPPADSKLARQLSATLDDLEALRRSMLVRIRQRATVLIPACAALGAAAGWALGFLDARGHSLKDVVLLAGFGALLGLQAARAPIARAYARRYKAEVLPKLASRVGDLHYRRRDRIDLGALEPLHLFRAFREVRGEDELHGEYRGLQVSLRSLRLLSRRGVRKDQAYAGLLVRVSLASRRPGETLVIDDAGPFGNRLDEIALSRLHPVGLVDPAFERDYQVYGSDQVMARVLLSPDVMEKLQSLRQGPDAPRPLLYARDSELFLLIPGPGRHNLFDPPSYRQPAASNSVLTVLDRDIAAALAVVDSVIDLDAATARAATD